MIDNCNNSPLCHIYVFDEVAQEYKRVIILFQKDAIEYAKELYKEYNHKYKIYITDNYGKMLATEKDFK